MKFKVDIVKEANEHAEKITINLAKKIEHLKKQLQPNMKAMEVICGLEVEEHEEQLNENGQIMQED